ncbi:hypothetical protein COCOBI_18-1800 [Coccomyxa sp. Obi]|nr:hypothetical protein COCOBI_18-1800 [Coccomyxa sp. Obi]
MACATPERPDLWWSGPTGRGGLSMMDLKDIQDDLKVLAELATGTNVPHAGQCNCASRWTCGTLFRMAGRMMQWTSRQLTHQAPNCGSPAFACAPKPSTSRYPRPSCRPGCEREGLAVFDGPSSSAQRTEVAAAGKCASGRIRSDEEQGVV